MIPQTNSFITEKMRDPAEIGKAQQKSKSEEMNLEQSDGSDSCAISGTCSAGKAISLSSVPSPSGTAMAEAAAPIAPATDAELDQAVAANNAFSLDLHRALAGKEQNFFLSPFNANTCMTMVLAGAKGSTADGLASALRQNELRGERLHAAVAGLMGKTGVDSEGVKVTLSNRFFSQDGFPLGAEFKDITGRAYGAQAQQLNFKSQPEDARETINGEVSKDTQEHIPSLLPEGSITPDTRVVLTSAIYFDGKWESKFPEENNQKGTFQSPDGPVDATFMNLKKEYKYAAINLDGSFPDWNREPDVKIVELPYQGRRFSRLVFVPRDAEGLKQLESKLTPETLEKWTGQMYSTEVDVHYPRNEMRSKFELKDPLTAMGAGELFVDGADLTGIGPGDLHVSNVFHETWVKDDNVGTKFTAATGAVVGIECVAMTNEVRADRPFFTLVKDNETGAILATQRVTKPEWNEN